MAGRRAPLSVLDLSPFGSGERPRDGLAHTLDLAREAESFGYARYWLAEHHANPGIAGAAPHVLAAAVLAATRRIRVGTAATIVGNRSALQVAEETGLLGALSGGRFDLGIGRSGSSRLAGGPKPPAGIPDRVVDGLAVPAPRLLDVDAIRFAVQRRLLGREDGDADAFPEVVDTILAFLRGDYVADEGIAIPATPAHDHGGVQVWLHGSSAGPTARLAGALGLRFGANYHVAPAFVIEAVRAYRDAFVPSPEVPEPYVIVSADVLVARTGTAAERIAAGYSEWVLSIRAGGGAIPYPRPEDALARTWTDAEEEVVRDRTATRFVGAPPTVVERLETLQRATGADELLVTTIAHDHDARVGSYRLLADAWGAA
ncbi:LLM class flavin-dependent oxidoreductase [uncultured Amnibacterium sp.]|uniref:LLM class flavin-dependent oxidoreductase n=1 Tax=uncultured Amnibacterium sp. TaxID=1631851 RepID=UPI0035CA48F9